MERYENVPKGVFKERRKYEILDGKISYMASGTSNHNRIIGNVFNILRTFMRGKKCQTFVNGVDVIFSEKDIFVPDVAVVCNKDIIKPDGIYGAPDLIVEVLSKSTAKKDISYKKNIYEKYGVKEYWLISQYERSIQVYLLKDGVYVFDNIYQIYEDYLIKGMDEEEKSEIIKEFKTSLYDDLIISVEEVFENVEL